MEGIVRRVSIDDSPFVMPGNSPSYPPTSYDNEQGRDVMALEMDHHEMGGGYLDPRSFGGYDEFNSSSISYEIPTSFVENPSMEPALEGFHQDSMSSSLNPLEIPPRNDGVQVYRVKTAEPPPSMQYIHVRTASPLKSSTSTSNLSSSSGNSRRPTSSRGSSKKEPIDPKKVEDEVARNVSQILAQTKQQRLAIEAQQKTISTYAQSSRLAFECPDCRKTVTNARNLQRHRLICPVLQMQTQYGADNQLDSQPFQQNINAQYPMQDGNLQSPMIQSQHQHSSMQNLSSISNEWSRSNSYSGPLSVTSQDHRLDEVDDLIAQGELISVPNRIDDSVLPPLSLDVDELRTHSSAGSLSSSSTGLPAFTCDSCKKSVSSSRSLKRHQTTCKQWIAEHGPPPDTERSQNPCLMARSATIIRGPVKVSYVSSEAPKLRSQDHSLQPAKSEPQSPTTTTTLFEMDTQNSVVHCKSTNLRKLPNLEIPNLERKDQAIQAMIVSETVAATPSCSGSSLISPADTVSSGYFSSASPQISPDSTANYPKPSTAANTCEDCNRQLCSASNLKRHKATCKVIMQRNGELIDRAEMLQQRIVASRKSRPSWPTINIKPDEKQIIDRSYAAALAACNQNKHHRPLSTGSSPAPSANNSSNKSTSFISQSPPPIPTSMHLSTSLNTSTSTSGETTPRNRVERPFITVGEHLKAQVQQQQRLMEHLNQRSIIRPVTVSPPPPNYTMPSSRARPYPTRSYVSPIMSSEKDQGALRPEVQYHQAAAKIEDCPLPLSSAGGAYMKAESFDEQCTALISEKNQVAKNDEDENQDQSFDGKKRTEPFENIITTQPLMSDRINASYSNSARDNSAERSSDAIQTSMPAGVMPTNSLSSRPLSSLFTKNQLAALTEYQCPECLKTYSCRKNVKRHRMAVHKQTPEEIAQNPGQTITVAPTTLTSSTCQSYMRPEATMTQSAPPTIGQPATFNSKMVRYPSKDLEDWDLSPTWSNPHVSNHHDDFGDDDDFESVETARIAAELKRSAEEELAIIEEKRPRTELAEADTTFHEETDLNGISSGGSLPPLRMLDSASMQSIECSTPSNTSGSGSSQLNLNQEFNENHPIFEEPERPRSIPTNPKYSQSSSRGGKIHICQDCSRILSSDYSLRRHRQTCPEAKIAKSRMETDDDSRNSNPISENNYSNSNNNTVAQNWFESNMEEADSTTSQRRDRSTSPVFRISGEPSPIEGSGVLQIPYHQPLPPASQVNPPMAIISPMVVNKAEGSPYQPSSQVAPPMSQAQSTPSPIAMTTRRRAAGARISQNVSPYGSNTGSPAPNGNGKQARHHCQDCDKYYSSEWNLERHRRESCPYKDKDKSKEQTQAQASAHQVQPQPQVQPSTQNQPTLQQPVNVMPSGANGEPLIQQPTSLQDEICIHVRSTRFYVSRAALSRSSGYFNQIFPQTESAKGGEVHLDIDPHAFQCLLDVHNCRVGLSPSNIDTVVDMASRLKFNAVFALCEDFIRDTLSQYSVMHAIRLADQQKLNSTKQRLFDTISLDVFRSLSADQNYRMMSADLKAELLEKWGSFL